ncbi:MAG: ATP synthase F1 subunit delta [Bacteroidota bacterium]
MTNQRVADRYAKSLLDLAVERKQLDVIKGDVDDLLGMTDASRELEVLLASPVVNPTKKKAVMAEILTKSGADELTQTFVRVLIDKGREVDLVGILHAFVAQYKVLNKISTVKVTSAKPLDAATLTAIKNQLVASGKTEASVDLHTAVDPSLLGGFVLEFDGKVYDASVAHKLDQIRKEIA